MKQYKNLFKKTLSFFLNFAFAFVFFVPFVSNLVKGRLGLDVAHGLDFDDLLIRGLTWLASLLTSLSSHILKVVANVFDFSINFATVYVPNNVFHTTYSVWAGIRDLGNLVIILFLGFIAISLITGFLGQATKKSVIWVLAAALLINFSGVITLFVYNTGNALAKSFLNDIKKIDLSGGKKEKPILCGDKVALCIANQVSITAKDESTRHKEIIDKYTQSGNAEKKALTEKKKEIQGTCKTEVKGLVTTYKKTFGQDAQGIGGSTKRARLIDDYKRDKTNECINREVEKISDAELRIAAFSTFDKLGRTNQRRAAFASSLLIFMLNIMLIVAFAYAAAGLFVVGVGIVIIYIISPIGLTAHMINKTGIPLGILNNIQTQWWKNLWGFSFFTPVFFVGLWITVSLISVFKDTTSNLSDFTIGSSAVGMILVYIMFMKSFEFAKATSGEVAGGITQIKDKGWKATKFVYNNRVSKALRDSLGHGINRVSGGYYATQAAVRHENRKTDFGNLRKSGFKPKNSIARFKHDIRKKEEAVMKDPTNVRKMNLLNQETLGAHKKGGMEPTEELKESLASNVEKTKGIEKNKKSLKEGEEKEKELTNSIASKTEEKDNAKSKNAKELIDREISQKKEALEIQKDKNTKLKDKIDKSTEEIKSGEIFNESNTNKHTLLQDYTNQTLHTFNEKDKDGDGKGKDGDGKDKDREIRELTKNEDSRSTSLLKGIKSLYEKGQDKMIEIGSGLHRHVNETTDATGEVFKQIQEKSYNALTDMHKEGGRLTKKGYDTGKQFIKDKLPNQKDQLSKQKDKMIEIGSGLHRHVNETTDATGEVFKQIQEKSYNALTDMHKEGGRLTKKGYDTGKQFIKDKLPNQKDQLSKQKDKRNKPE